jgi:hypothetical protein
LRPSDNSSGITAPWVLAGGGISARQGRLELDAPVGKSFQ